MSTTTLPGVDFSTLSSRRRYDAVAKMQQARRQADAESSKTIRECNFDAAVVSARRGATQPQATAAIPNRLPPYVYAAALLALFVLVGGLLTLSSAQHVRNSLDGGVQAGSSSQWRDGVETAVS